ncbi:MAG: CopG family transcriptional regulator [Cyanobacteria bacterium]|nr:CopG family transcriptional regulator [Cyanobacteria bacterium GSL.Bin21]
MSQDTKTSRYQDILKTKPSTLRLEETIATELTLLCKREGISREVLVEAMFLYCQENPSALESVLEDARTRNEKRQEISNRKRAQTMMKRFGEDTEESR